MFPLSYEGSFEIPVTNGTDDKVLKDAIWKIVARLEESKPGKLFWNSNEIRFTGGIFRFVLNWNLLYTISSGEINIRANSYLLLVVYKLRFVKLFLIMFLVFTLLTVFDTIQYGVTSLDLFSLIFWGLWMLNYILIPIVRFRHALSSTLKHL